TRSANALRAAAQRRASSAPAKPGDSHHADAAIIAATEAGRENRRGPVLAGGAGRSSICGAARRRLRTAWLTRSPPTRSKTTAASSVRPFSYSPYPTRRDTSLPRPPPPTTPITDALRTAHSQRRSVKETRPDRAEGRTP